MNIRRTTVAYVCVVSCAVIFLACPGRITTRRGFPNPSSPLIFCSGVIDSVYIKSMQALQRYHLNPRDTSDARLKITTDYHYYQGSSTGILWWKRRFQERCKYLLVFEIEKCNTTAITIFAQTERRISDRKHWSITATDSLQSKIHSLKEYLVSEIRQCQLYKGACSGY